MNSIDNPETSQTEKKQGISSNYCIGSKFWNDLNLYGGNKHSKDMPKADMPKADMPKADMPKAEKKQGISSNYCIGSKFWNDLNLYGGNKHSKDMPKADIPKESHSMDMKHFLELYKESQFILTE